MSLSFAAKPGFAPDQLIGLGVVVGVGLLLWWGSALHPASMPAWGPWDFSWPEYLAAALGGWWYARGVALSAPAERPGFWRQLSYFLGVLAIYAVLQTHYDYMAQHMFFLNRIQHVMMHHIGPFLIALAWPGAALRRGMPAPLRRLTENHTLGRVMHWVQQPFLAGFLFVGLVALWLIPPVHFRAMLDPRLYAVMNWSMVIDGLLFWCLVLDPRPWPPARTSIGVRLLLPIATMFPQIFLGAFITFQTRDVYPFYDLCGRLYPSIGAIYDQQIGGIVVWIPPSMMAVVGFLLVLNALRRHEDAMPVPAAGGNARPVISSAAWTGR